MKDIYLAYLHAIQVGDPIENRIDELLEELEWLCPEDLERIFVSDQITPQGEDRIFTSLWAFSNSYLMEAKQFLSDIHFDIAPMLVMNHLDIETSDFPLSQTGRARKTARLSVRAVLGNGITAGGVDPPGVVVGNTFPGGSVQYTSLTATGRNCTYLAAIVRDVFRPLLITQS